MQAECNNPSQSQNEVDLKRQLSRALLHFQDRLLEANISPGSLCQVEPVKRSNDERRLCCCATPQQPTVAYLCTRPAMRRTYAFAFGQTALSGSTQPR